MAGVALVAAIALLGAGCAEVAERASDDEVADAPAPAEASAEASEDFERPTEFGQPSGVAHREADEDEAEDAPEPVDPVTPTRVRVPTIEVDDELVPVGLLDSGAMEVPDFGLAGWYDLGPMPGEAGPSVIAAHVDSRSGPDVFYRLHELEPGDLVHVDREDGSTVTFEVEDREQVDKDELPTDRIWNDTDDAVLRLITCGGAFDRSIGHYTDNIIVYATLVDVG